MLAPSATRRLLDRFAEQRPSSPDLLDGLTEREIAVLRLLADGSTNAEIAATLVIAEGTVKTRVGRLLDKLHARDRVQLVLFAQRPGLR